MSGVEMMRAAVYRGQHAIAVEEAEIPHARAGELLLEVGTVGVCGSDVSEWANGPRQHPYVVRHRVTGHLGPIIPGHEFSGTVVATGDGVDPAWVGRQVASCGSIACGVCEPCRDGRSNQCPSYAGVGLHRHGALAEFVATPVANCRDIGGLGISLDEAALCQPMSIAVHNVSRAGAVAGQTVLVQGVGGIGAFLVCALNAAGAEVVATDVDPGRLEIAASFGAARVLQVAGGAEDLDLVRDTLGDTHLSVIFEVSGSRSGIESALNLAPRGCRIVVVGIQKAPVELDLSVLTFEEKSLIGTNALVRETDFPRAVDLIAARRGQWGAVAPRVVPLEALVDEALLPMSQGRPRAIKTLIDPRVSEVRALMSAP